MQYTTGVKNISAIYFIGIATKPIAEPSVVNGTRIASKETIIDDIYTGLDAWLCKNGIFDVLIMCIPNRFDTIPYENHIVWNNAASAGPNLNTNHNIANTIKSNAELSGPIKIINCLIARMLHFLGFFKESTSTLSNGKVNWPISYNKLCTSS